MDGTGGALHDEKLGLDPDHAETEHKEKPGPGPDQPKGLPSSRLRNAHGRERGNGYHKYEIRFSEVQRLLTTT